MSEHDNSGTFNGRGTTTATASSVKMNFGGLTFVSASVPSAFNATTRTWTVGDLAAGASQTIRLTFRGAVGGTYSPSARASTTATELRTTNNVAVSTIAPPPSLGGGSAFNQYAPLTRLWLASRFFG